MPAATCSTCAADRAGEGDAAARHEDPDRRVGTTGPLLEERVAVDLRVDLAAQARVALGEALDAQVVVHVADGVHASEPRFDLARFEGVSTQPVSLTTPSATSMPTASKGP